jgi:hypothetical protein
MAWMQLINQWRVEGSVVITIFGDVSRTFSLSKVTVEGERERIHPSREYQ